MRTTTVRPGKLIQAVLLLLFTIFLCRLVLSQGIYMLVSPLIAGVVKLSIVFFGILGLVTLLSSVKKTNTVTHTRQRSRHQNFLDHEPAHTHDHYHNHDHHHGDGHHHSHDHGHHHVSLNSPWGRTTVGLLVMCLALAFTWHPQALGTNMIAQASTSIGSTQPASGQGGTGANGSASAGQNNPNASGSSQAVSADTANYYASVDNAVMQKSNEFSAAQIAVDFGHDPSTFLGHQVTLDGFVYHPSSLPANYFIITRYFIFCCIADAAPMGVVVETPMGSILKNDQWVSVSGVLQNLSVSTTLNQYAPTSWYPSTKTQPILVAGTTKNIPVPKLPYMVPTY